MNYQILSPNSHIKKDLSKGLRIIGGLNTVIHCHHYNARIQSTIESQKGIDGKKIVREAAQKVFAKQFANILKDHPHKNSYVLACEHYAYSGYGKINFYEKEHIVTAPISHFVEGYQWGDLKRKGHVCSVTEGYITGCLYAITGDYHPVEEIKCANDGHNECVFRILPKSDEKLDLSTLPGPNLEIPEDFLEAFSNIDKKKVIETLSAMPVYGNDEGLIPGFGVYLANTPQDFYNLICYGFIREMDKIGKLNVAQSLLIEDAEFCALNTFSGIMSSDEWRELITPMAQTKEDSIFALVAIANALGWGRLFIRSHSPFQSLELHSYNGYEAYGYLQNFGMASTPQCLMLNGVSSGLMALIYQTGEFEDRLGLYLCEETACLTNANGCCCRFNVKTA